MPATAASRYCSGFSLSSLCVTRVPSGRLPTTSVKVPPRSIQNCQSLRSRVLSLFCMVLSLFLVRRLWLMEVERNKNRIGFVADSAHPLAGEAFAHVFDFAFQVR